MLKRLANENLRPLPGDWGRSDVGATSLGRSNSDDSPQVVLAQNPDPGDLTIVENSVVQDNLKRAGPHAYRTLAAFLRDAQDGLLGGITGRTYWGWFAIDFLWVAEKLRGRGYGKQLLSAAENQAREWECHHAYLDTFTFQAAVGFYQKLGYTQFGSLPDFPRGHQRIFLYKALVD
jgi:GNAT superfamily N-acetyltransferase